MGAPIIYLNMVMLEPTKRFVLAHELAHVILRIPRVRNLIHMRGADRLLMDEETLADRLAATILMPDSWIENLRRTRCSPGQLSDIAQIAEISIMRLVERMSASGMDISLLHWRKRNNEWRVIDRPGTPSRLHGYIKPSPTGHDALDALFKRVSSFVVDCEVNGRRARIAGQGYRNGSHAFQLLNPSIDIWVSRESTGF
jgi:IrrE N-terminal-like domain